MQHQTSATRGIGIPMRMLAGALALALVIGGFAPLFPASALAEETGSNPDTTAEPSAEQTAIEQSAAAYEAATAHVAELEQQITDNEARIDEITQQLPEQQERSANATRALYKMNQQGCSLVDMVLGSQSIGDFLSNVEYIMRVQNSNYAEIVRLEAMQSELEETRQSLTSAKDEAKAEEARAEQALAEAQAARERAQREAQERAAQAAAEQARLAEEQAAAEKKAQEEAASSSSETEAGGNTSNGSSSSGSTTEAVTPPPSDNADWSSDKASFVASWAGRIDAYLAGSPMAGCGKYYAAAAWDYGVDPRFSPAISCVESSKGAACFASHNAWGWGSSSWGSWEEAIDAHVRGLARGYGYTLTYEGAQKYCPPNADFWYNRVAAEMAKI
ncbi:MAG: hypothetical protein Q4C41_01935 [Eggerthellaceae bacterium]|nr:hypothetical protein [Eggerthellaceae bacterium]